MADEYRSAVLRGFDTAVADVGDQLHLCQPLLSFEGDPTLYVARRLDWQNDPKALAAVDPSEASELGTLLPDAYAQAIASGEAVAVVGTKFVQAATAAGIQLDDPEMTFVMVGDAEYRMSVAAPERFAKLRARLADEARTVFDEELGYAAYHGSHLSERGNAALLLLRRCGPRRRDDLAIRQLAGALQNCELDLYRRLLIRFSLELRTQENDLDEKAKRHVTAASFRHISQSQPPPKRYVWKSLPNPKIYTYVFLNYTAFKEVSDLEQHLLASGGILYKVGMFLAMGHSHSSDFRDSIQQDSEDLCRMFVQPYSYYSKLSSSKLSRLLHKSEDLLLPRSSRKQAPRKSVIPAKAGIQGLS